MASEEEDMSLLLPETRVSDEPIGLSDVISAVISESIVSNKDKFHLSPDEVTWADSCLVFDAERSDDEWKELRECLLDALGAQNSSDKLEKYTRDDKETKPAIIHNEEDREMQGDGEADKEDAGSTKNGEAELKSSHVREHYMPENETMHGDDDRSEDSGRFDDDIESHENIFKVWDLETPTPDEEDELIKELKKLLKSSNPEDFGPLTSDDPSFVVSQEEIDELVADMDELSL